MFFLPALPFLTLPTAPRNSSIPAAMRFFHKPPMTLTSRLKSLEPHRYLRNLPKHHVILSFHSVERTRETVHRSKVREKNTNSLTLYTLYPNSPLCGPENWPALPIPFSSMAKYFTATSSPYTQPVSSWTFWPFYQVKPSYMFWLFFCSTFWSTSRVKLTTSICFKTMQVLPARKAPLPDRQGHLSTCFLYVLALQSLKSHALTSIYCWR